MLRDTARIVTVWEGAAKQSSDISSSMALSNYLKCYSNSRSMIFSASEDIKNMQDCVYTVLDRCSMGSGFRNESSPKESCPKDASIRSIPKAVQAFGCCRNYKLLDQYFFGNYNPADLSLFPFLASSVYQKISIQDLALS